MQKLTDRINLVARENLNGINVVHAYNAEDYQNAKFQRGNEELMHTQLFNQRAFAFLMPGVTLAMNALSLVIYWVGASIVNAVPATDTAARLATFSNIVVFGTYATYVIMSIMMMVMIIMLIPAAQVSAQRINEVLETRNSLTQGTRTDAPEAGTVEFRDVSFHYPSSDKNVLEHISFTARRGETVAFIGATGSGKTTLVSLAARFYDATEGQVLVDGVDVRDYTFDALYDRVGYMTQKAVLFSGDIRSNVLFGASRGGNSDGDVPKGPGPGPGQRICGQDARRHPRPHRRGGHQRLRRTEAAALHRPGFGETAGDPGVRRLLFRPGLSDGCKTPCRPGPGAEGHHPSDRGPAHRHHTERGQDHRPGRGEDGGDGHPQGTDAVLPRLSGDRPVPALPGRAGGIRRDTRCQI